MIYSLLKRVNHQFILLYPRHDAVFLQLPYGCATHPCHFIVDIQDGIRCIFQLVGVHGPVNVVGGVLMQAEVEKVVAADHQSPALPILYPEPAHIGAVAMFLRDDIGHIHFIGVGLIDTHFGACLSVRVGFKRATSLPFHIAEGLGQLELQPGFLEHVGHWPVGDNFLFKLNGAIAFYRPYFVAFEA